MAGFPMGAGHGLLSCPAGAGLFPGLHYQAAATAATGGGAAKGVTAAFGAPGPVGPIGTAAPVAAKGVVAGGTVVGCKGLSLGLGIGLGFWGPLVLAGLGVAAAYTLWKSRQTVAALSEDDQEFQDTVTER